MRGDKCHPGRGKRVKIPLLPINVGKKSANDAGPQQGQARPFDHGTSPKEINMLLLVLLFQIEGLHRGAREN